MAVKFKDLIYDILQNENFKSMKKYVHHGNVSAYTHSVSVAYLCYKYHIAKNPKYDIKEFVRGALLHDYYLYDWHNTGEGHRLHGFRHPFFAYKNAKRDFVVTPLMKDIITHHMFPLTVIPPKSKAAWKVSYFDKVATIRDYKNKKKRKKALKHR